MQTKNPQIHDTFTYNKRRKNSRSFSNLGKDNIPAVYNKYPTIRREKIVGVVIIFSIFHYREKEKEKRILPPLLYALIISKILHYAANNGISLIIKPP